MDTQQIGPDTTWRNLHPRITTLWWIKGALSDLITLSVLTAAVALTATNTDWAPPQWIFSIPAGIWVALLLFRLWYVTRAYTAWTFKFGEQHLELRHGVWWRSTSSVPYHRLQQVDEAQGPLERSLGMARVQLRSAAATTDASIPGIPIADVAEIRRLLMLRAGHSDGT